MDKFRTMLQGKRKAGTVDALIAVATIIASTRTLINFVKKDKKKK